MSKVIKVWSVVLIGLMVWTGGMEAKAQGRCRLVHDDGANRYYVCTDPYRPYSLPYWVVCWYSLCRQVER